MWLEKEVAPRLFKILLATVSSLDAILEEIMNMLRDLSS
jgi:hypothetical protein